MDEVNEILKNEVIILDGRTELQDYSDYWVELFKDSLPNTIIFWGTAASFLVILAYVSRELANIFIFFLFGALLLLSVPLLTSFYGYSAYIRMGHRYLKSLSEKERWTTVIFKIENDGFEWINGRNYSYIAWSSIECVVETKKYFALKRQIHTYLLTKDMFKNQSQINFFKFLLKSKLGNKSKFLN